MKWEKLLMPRGIDRDQSKFEGNHAEVVLQPLEEPTLTRTLFVAVRKGSGSTPTIRASTPDGAPSSVGCLTPG